MTGVEAWINAAAVTSASWGSGASPLVTAIVSVCVGAALGFGGSYLLGRQQRGWQREQIRFDRELELVKGLDEALVEAERRVLKRELPEDSNQWGAAHEAWEQAWVRLSPFVANQEVHDRYEVVGSTLNELLLYEGEARPATLRNVALRATQNARQAIAYFGREEKLPTRSFPGPDELRGLLEKGDPDPFDRDAPLARWLKDHPAAPWRGEDPR